MNALPTFLGGRPRQRANSDICRSTRDLLQKFATGVAPSPKIEEELARNLGHMKLTLQGTTGSIEDLSSKAAFTNPMGPFRYRSEPPADSPAHPSPYEGGYPASACQEHPQTSL